MPLRCVRSLPVASPTWPALIMPLLDLLLPRAPDVCLVSLFVCVQGNPLQTRLTLPALTNGVAGLTITVCACMRPLRLGHRGLSAT